MKSKFIVFITSLAAALSGCGNQQAGNNATAPRSSPVLSGTAVSPSPVATAVSAKNGDYPGKGVVTKIDLELGSVELNHEAIKDVMPAMQMEFFVTDKKLLDGLKVGDKVDFVLRYKDHTETISNIKKVP
ncbi:MAG TPA: copper-binding protein [Pyrinomonadaceae bacterium]|nr:copper-binding protein [Pyrinomonadaceae bacterium]